MLLCLAFRLSKKVWKYTYTRHPNGVIGEERQTIKKGKKSKKGKKGKKGRKKKGKGRGRSEAHTSAEWAGNSILFQKCLMRIFFLTASIPHWLFCFWTLSYTGAEWIRSERVLISSFFFFFFPPFLPPFNRANEILIRTGIEHQLSLLLGNCCSH